MLMLHRHHISIIIPQNFERKLLSFSESEARNRYNSRFNIRYFVRKNIVRSSLQ